MNTPATFHASRTAALETRAGGHSLTRFNYFLDADSALDTNEQLDWHAGGTSAGCYMKQFDAIWLAHGLETIYVISRIYAHGTKNYENGWDYLVECIAPNKIVPVILALPEEFTINDAIRAVADAFDLELLNDACNDALAAGGLPVTTFKTGLG